MNLKIRWYPRGYQGSPHVWGGELMGSLNSFKEVFNRLRMYGNGFSVAIVLDHRCTATSLTGNLPNIIAVKYIWYTVLCECLSDKDFQGPMGLGWPRVDSPVTTDTVPQRKKQVQFSKSIFIFPHFLSSGAGFSTPCISTFFASNN